MNLHTKINTFRSWHIICVVLLGIILVAGWFIFSGVQAPNKRDDITIVTNEVDTPHTTTSTTSDQYKIYRNDDFGFSFAYPNDWAERVPEFGSPISLFNMSIRPAGYEGIGDVVINLTPKYWIEGAIKKMESRGVVFKEILLDGRKAYTTEDKDRISRPSTITLVLVGDEYWIDITGVKGNEEVYNMVLDSFEIK